MPFVPLWDSLVQLWTNLLRDIGTMGRTLEAPAAKWATQILEVVDLTLLSPDLRTWLDRIPSLLTKALSCPAGTCPEQLAAVEMTMDILTRSLRDGFGRGFPDEHYEHIVEEVIRADADGTVRRFRRGVALVAAGRCSKSGSTGNVGVSSFDTATVQPKATTSGSVQTSTMGRGVAQGCKLRTTVP